MDNGEVIAGLVLSTISASVYSVVAVFSLVKLKGKVDNSAIVMIVGYMISFLIRLSNWVF